MSPMGRIAFRFSMIVLGSALAGCSGGGASAAADYRGDPLCASAQVDSAGSACDLSVTMHGHAYRLTCDLSQQSCTCSRDNRRIPGVYGFGGSTTPTCTISYLDVEWSDCCGTPE